MASVMSPPRMQKLLPMVCCTIAFFGFGIIEMLMVAPSARLIGIGRSLVRHLAGDCETEKFWSSKNQSNHAMQTLLVSEGFSQSGIIDNLAPGNPELVFYKMLPK